MKRYFDFKLSGCKVMWPIWAILVVSIVAALPEIFAEDFYIMTDGNVVADAAYFGVVVGCWLLALIGPMLLLYPITKATIEACGMDGERVATDYSFGRYALLALKGSLLSIVTLGIYMPWFLVEITRYFFDGATYRLRPFGFHAKPMPLFVILTLLLFVPMVLLGIVLSYMVVGYESLGMSDVTMALAAVLLLVVVVALCNPLVAARLATSLLPTERFFVLGMLLRLRTSLGLPRSSRIPTLLSYPRCGLR